jgi:subtilisin family serine protease
MKRAHLDLRRWTLVLVPVATIALAALASAEPARIGRGAGGGGGSSQIVGIIVKLEDAPVVTYQGTIPDLPATSRKGPSGKLDRGGPAVQAYRGHLGQKHAAFEAAARSAIPAAQTTYRFDVIFGGVAMQVPENQIAQVAQLPGVKAVYRDVPLRLHTDTSPHFIGVASVWGELQGQGRAGEGVIVGVLDTGIWPEHPSFADPDASGKPYPPPPTIPTQCAFTDGANPGPSFVCNNKLIGAYRMMQSYDACVARGDCEVGGDFSSARDSSGHGTHTASTAAGNGNVPASIFGIDRKQVSGIAPRAHVIAYKVCGLDTCWASDAIAAVQQAVLDGVDVINFSIGGGVTLDPLELAFRDAYGAGIFVAASAGNEGPDANTVNHRGPWVTSVAASTENRTFETTLTLVGADGTRLKLTGSSITPGIGVPTPVVVPDTDPTCEQNTPADLTGKIVVCKRGGNSGRQEKSFNVAQRGAAGMVLYNPIPNEDVESDNHAVPSVHLMKAAADMLLPFLAAHAPVTATFPISVARNAQGDVITFFSSRGGTATTLGISKPDITAPGIQILAGQTPEPIDPADPGGQLFQAIAGTSMSSPHIAGAGAVLKDLHPAWTPGQIKSALMTTASTAGLVTEDGVTAFTPFDAGSGRVDLKAAQSPGVTFDVPTEDYVAHVDDLWTLNHPSVYIPDVAPDVVTVRRTALNLESIDAAWSLTVIPDSRPGMTVGVPSTLAVPGGGTASFDIRIDKTGIPAAEARHATLRLTSKSTTLHMPITAAGPVARPDLIVTDVIIQSSGTGGRTIYSTATVRNVGAATAGPFYYQVYLSRNDRTVSADDIPFWFWNVPSMPPGQFDMREFTFTVSPAMVPAGTYYLVVRADDGEQVSESNENNNVESAGPITLTD